MSNVSYEKLLEALDLHHNLLHAEMQAIAARDLNTVEDILGQKDQSLDLLLLAKRELGPDFPPHIQSRISSVLNLQEKNTKSFRNLHVQDNQPKDSGDLLNPLFKRLKQAYSK